ncbi:hypothetical protein [Adhaeribacter terreus]|uniref:Outer membrane protein beta-barrel domain-containing protein n=1 Tax=Adhaeribacter terreus TaxID=529703 RepID=A0ABW0ECQ5_9BACT
MKTKLLTFIAFFCTVFSFNSFAQTSDSVAVRRTVGLSANVQNSELGITVPIFISQKFVLAPALGFTYAEGIATDISFGIMPKYYFETGRFAPYSALRIGAIMNKPNSENMEAKSTTDLFAGIAGGAEYFPIPNFSFGVEGQINFTKAAEGSSRFGNTGGITANLGTAVTANIYFTRK